MTHKDAMEISKEDGQSASEWALPVGLTREWPQSPLTLSATWACVALLCKTEPSDSDSAQTAVASENGTFPKRGVLFSNLARLIWGLPENPRGPKLV